MLLLNILVRKSTRAHGSPWCNAQRILSTVCMVVKPVMVAFMCQFGSPRVLAVWSNAHRNVAVKIFCGHN